LNETQAVQDKLQQALDRNSALVSRLRSESARRKAVDSADASIAKGTDASDTTQPIIPPTAPPTAPPATASTKAPDAAGTNPVAPSPSDLPTPGSVSTVPAFAAPMSLAQAPTVAITPVCFAAPLCWLISIAFGGLAAFLAAWLAERRDPSIRSESMLRRVLPTSAAYLGGIPRVRHEVIPE